MIIQLNPKEFISEFVNPINDLNREGKIALFCSDGELYSISTTKSKTIYLYNTYKPLNIEDPIERCSLNIQKLVKGLGCVSSDEMFVTLEIKKDQSDINGNTCSFSSRDIRFTIRLLEDLLIEVPKFQVSVFKKFEVHHVVNIDAAKVSNIKKALDFAIDSPKFHVEQEGSDVFFYFGEKNSTSNHSDGIKILVAENVETQVPNKIYDIDLLRLVLKFKNDFSLKMNDNGAVYVEIENNNTNLKYITTPLKK